MKKSIYIFLFYMFSTCVVYANTGIINGVDINSMKDIYDIKVIKTSFVVNFLFYPIYIIVFFLFYYYILNKYFNIDKEKMEEEKRILKSFNNAIIKKLIYLKNSLEKLNKINFYTRFNNIIREYFSGIGIEKIDNKTLKEVKKYKNEKNEDIINLFEKTYFWEFNFENDDFEIRKRIIDEAVIFINKK